METTTKTPTLLQILCAQGDMPEKGAEKICDAALNNAFDASSDPISAIIVNSFENNDYSDYESMVTDLSYAINQLTRAKEFIERIIKQ